MTDTFQPHEVRVDVNTLRNIKDALENGQQYAHDCLAEHDLSLGRTTRKNKLTAEAMETDIAKMGTVMLVLNQIIGDK